MEALDRIERESKGSGVRFFGSPIPIEGDGVIFVIDVSASMIVPVAPPPDAPPGKARWTKLDLAKWELKKAIAMLPEEARFNVIFFDECPERWRYEMQPARPAGKREAYAWIRQVPARGKSNLTEAVSAAFLMDGRNTILLLSDGKPNVIDCRTMAEAPPLVHLERIRAANTKGQPLLCFGFSDDAVSDEFLKHLAVTSGGRYNRISARSL
jgi:hypothetical protein